MRQQLDSVDRKILHILQKNARTSLKDIASQVYLSSPATSARIEKLEREGYILGYHMSVNREKLGSRIKAFVRVKLVPSRKDAFLQMARNSYNVIECSCITGEYEMLLEVVSSSTQELESFVHEVQRYGKTHTQIVFSTVIEHREICPLVGETA
ncbi:MAG: Lrp/AsnC family transcriptional regulator [bacterium]|nr:Lrp/AsnC family transcriptional regulator [bacterium]